MPVIPAQYDLIVKQGDLEAIFAWILADGAGPVLIPAASTAAFRMIRMGVTPVRIIADGSTTAGSNLLGSVAANFYAPDVGATVTGPGIPALTTILAVNPTLAQATMSANATATTSGVAATISRVMLGGVCTIGNQQVTPGLVTYTWQTADLANPGSYWAEFEITYPDLKTRTFPNNRQLNIQIGRELG